MAYSSPGVALAKTSHIVPVVVVAGNPISAPLAVAGHHSITVVVTGDPVCSASAKSSAHVFLLSLQ